MWHGCAILAVGLVTSFTSCSSVRSGYQKTDSQSLPPALDSAFGPGPAEIAATHPGQSGFHALDSNIDAFAARVALADAARQSLDMQYYYIHAHVTARLLMERVLAAADRGVRVRMLIDDIGLLGRDARLGALDHHENIEVRVFNPFVGRDDPSGVTRIVEFLADRRRLNHRMHNKLFAADNRAAIIGGRNLGDQYFSEVGDRNFQDLDLLAIGPVVQEASRAFDRYWNSRWAVPVQAFRTARASPGKLTAARRGLAALRRTEPASSYLGRVGESNLPARLRKAKLPWIWARARVVCDLPEKVAGIVKPEEEFVLGPHLARAANDVRSELIVITPYFIPGEGGLRFFQRLRQRGVRVRVLTNSLGSTDVASVHGVYGRYRDELLKMGVELHEFKPAVTPRRRRHGYRLSKLTSMHAKAYVFDGSQVCVGSLNADPRSARLNTEMGLLVESADLAKEVCALFEEATLPANSYRLHLDARGRLLWTTEENGRTCTRRAEPKAALHRHLAALLCSLLPLEEEM
ncbi:MAG: phospholipase D family protein [Verrucomicrobiales bacterium]